MKKHSWDPVWSRDRDSCGGGGTVIIAKPFADAASGRFCGANCLAKAYSTRTRRSRPVMFTVRVRLEY